MKALVFFLFCLFWINNLKSQDSTEVYMNRINYIFANVDHNQASTGLLSDYGIHAIPPEYYDGTLRDSNEVDISVWKTLYNGVYSSRFNSKSSLSSTDNVSAMLAQNIPVAGGYVSIPVMCLNYNKLRDDAYTAGLVQVQNEVETKRMILTR